MEDLISQLEKKVDELTAWKDARIKERLIYPLDVLSTKIIQDGQLVFTGVYPAVASAIQTDLSALGLGITINGVKRFIHATVPLYSFTPNSGTDVFTDNRGNHNLKNGDLVIFATEDTLPTGLDTTIIYYVINISGSTFQVSLTLGGPAVNIIDTGIGVHFYGKSII